MNGFFKIANSHKNMSRDFDIDESIKKASSKKGRHVFKYYRLKNNDYGFGFIGMHSGLSEQVNGFKGSGFCHNLIPEVSKKQKTPGAWSYYGEGFDSVMKLVTGGMLDLEDQLK